MDSDHDPFDAPSRAESTASSQDMWDTFTDYNAEITDEMLSSPSKRSKYETDIMDSDEDSTLVSANESTSRSGSAERQKRKADSELASPSPNKVARAASYSDIVLEERDITPDVLPEEAENTPEILHEDSSADLNNTEGVINVAYSPFHHGYIQGLPWAVQWELARLVTGGLKYDDFPISQLAALRECSSIEEGVELANRLFDPSVDENKKKDAGRWQNVFEQETAAKAPWEELEHEARVIEGFYDHRRRCVAGATCTQHHLYLTDDDGWYGGKVHFTGRLRYDHKTKKFDVILEKPYLFSSTRFARRFGSDAFVRLRVDSRVLYQHGKMVRDYVKKPLLISGRVFRAFFAKEETIFFFRTNDVVDTSQVEDAGPAIRVREPQGPSIDPLALSLIDFLHWHNPVSLNDNQSIAKWASRFALALSNSVPGVRVAPKNLKRIGDILSPGYKGLDKDAPAEKQMSDGCGLANANFFLLSQEQLRWDTAPVAVQMRINGAKGLLVLDPNDAVVTADRIPRVQIRDSQQKIQYPDDPTQPVDEALFTVDVLRPAHMGTPARLSVETIINLAENGVPVSVFTTLMKVGLEERVDGLTRWDDAAAGYTPMSLWANLAREGGVFSARLARMQAGAARAKGYVYEDRADGDEEFDASKAQSSAWWDDPVSGCPSSLEEISMQLLDAGFSPAACPPLRERLKTIAVKALRPTQNTYRMPVPMSCTAFIIPDPTGTLEAGEVHIKSSHRNLLGPDGQVTELIEGDVLLTRHPCKVPTDVQKATAVYKRELRNYVDVIVVSVRGHKVNGEYIDCHLASMTGGGDYDGDIMEAFWAPDIIASFEPAKKEYALDPVNLEDCLVKNNTTVKKFVHGLTAKSYQEQLSGYQKHLLASLVDASLVGLYSNLWEESIYIRGYSNPETILLSYIFCKILDGGKTGVTVKTERVTADRAKRSPRGVPWKQDITEKVRASAGSEGFIDKTNSPDLKRGRGLKSFIMDHLRDAVKAECDRQHAIIDIRLKPLDPNNCYDHDLGRPWEAFLTNKLGDNEAARKAIHAHVREVQKKHKVAITTDLGPDKKFNSLPIVVRQDRLRALSKLFAEGPSDVYITIGPDGHDLATLKASCAYYLDRASRFPFDVAFRTLCDIKAKAASHGAVKTVSGEFYTSFSIKPSFLHT